MEAGAQRVRQLVASLGVRGPRTRIPDHVREAAARFALEQRRRGATWYEVSQATGLSRESLRRFAGTGRPRSRVSMVAVRVAPDVDPKRVAVTAPGGYRVEDLSLEEAAGLLRLLA